MRLLLPPPLLLHLFLGILFAIVFAWHWRSARRTLGIASEPFLFLLLLLEGGYVVDAGDDDVLLRPLLLPRLLPLGDGRLRLLLLLLLLLVLVLVVGHQGRFGGGACHDADLAYHPDLLLSALFGLLLIFGIASSVRGALGALLLPLLLLLQRSAITGKVLSMLHCM